MEKWYEIQLNNEKRPYFRKGKNKDDVLAAFVKEKWKNNYETFDMTKLKEIKPSKKVNFDEIVEKFASAKYTVDVPWEYIEDSLKRYMEAYNLQLEPDFQRAHVWTEDQQIAYIEYAMKGGKSGKEIFFNAPNWQGRGDVTEMVLVDGLQRLTAVTKFMNDKLKVFGGYVASDFQHLSMSECGFKISINDLNTRKEVLEWYINFNSAGTQHTEQELNKVKKLLENEK